MIFTPAYRTTALRLCRERGTHLEHAELAAAKLVDSRHHVCRDAVMRVTIAAALEAAMPMTHEDAYGLTFPLIDHEITTYHADASIRRPLGRVIAKAKLHAGYLAGRDLYANPDESRPDTWTVGKAVAAEMYLATVMGCVVAGEMEARMVAAMIERSGAARGGGK